MDCKTALKASRMCCNVYIISAACLHVLHFRPQSKGMQICSQTILRVCRLWCNIWRGRGHSEHLVTIDVPVSKILGIQSNSPNLNQGHIWSRIRCDADLPPSFSLPSMHTLFPHFYAVQVLSSFHSPLFLPPPSGRNASMPPHVPA